MRHRGETGVWTESLVSCGADWGLGTGRGGSGIFYSPPPPFQIPVYGSSTFSTIRSKSGAQPRYVTS
eukprot:3892558-Prymnesium_polylepis.1